MNTNPQNPINPFLNFPAVVPSSTNPPTVAEVLYMQNQIRMAAMMGHQIIAPPPQLPLLSAATGLPHNPAAFVQSSFSPHLPFTLNEHILNWARAQTSTVGSVGFDGLGDQRRGRQTYTRYQTAALEKEFSAHTYLSRARRIIISDMLNLSERQIKIWFQNRRMKHKREQQSVGTVSGADKVRSNKRSSTELKSPSGNQSVIESEVQCKASPPTNTRDTELKGKDTQSPVSHFENIESGSIAEQDDSISMDSDGGMILEQSHKTSKDELSL